jgi:hypothetical protein
MKGLVFGERILRRLMYDNIPTDMPSKGLGLVQCPHRGFADPKLGCVLGVG